MEYHTWRCGKHCGAGQLVAGQKHGAVLCLQMFVPSRPILFTCGTTSSRSACSTAVCLQPTRLRHVRCYRSARRPTSRKRGLDVDRLVCRTLCAPLDCSRFYTSTSKERTDLLSWEVGNPVGHREMQPHNRVAEVAELVLAGSSRASKGCKPRTATQQVRRLQRTDRPFKTRSETCKLPAPCDVVLGTAPQFPLAGTSSRPWAASAKWRSHAVVLRSVTRIS